MAKPIPPVPKRRHTVTLLAGGRRPRQPFEETYIRRSVGAQKTAATHRPRVPNKKGRPKGIPHLDRGVEVRQEIRTLAYNMVTDPVYLKNLRGRLRKGRAPHMEMTLFHYAFGKPAERVRIEDTRQPQITAAVQDFKAKLAQLAARMLEERVNVTPLPPAS